MTKDLTRDQAVALVGEDAVWRVDRENCEPTNRVGFCGAPHGDKYTEWSASVSCEDTEGRPCVLRAYYYTANWEDELMAEAGDGSYLTWVTAAYEVV